MATDETVLRRRDLAGFLLLGALAATLAMAAPWGWILPSVFLRWEGIIAVASGCLLLGIAQSAASARRTHLGSALCTSLVMTTGVVLGVVGLAVCSSTPVDWESLTKLTGIVLVWLIGVGAASMEVAKWKKEFQED